VQARQAVDTTSAAEKKVISKWITYPILGRGPAMALLSMPLMLLSPGLWATLNPLSKINISVRWDSKAFEGVDPFDISEQAARNAAMREVSSTYIGSLSALNWTDRSKVLEFFAAQNFINNEVTRLLKEGLYGGGALVCYQTGGALAVIGSTGRSERSDGSAYER